MRWALIIGLLAVVYWQYGEVVDGATAEQGGPEDWRRRAGVLAVLLGLTCYLAVSVLGAVKRRRSISGSDPRAALVFAGSTVETVLLAGPAIFGAVGAGLLFSADQSSTPTLLLATGGAVLSILSAFLIFVNLVAGPFRLTLSEAGLDYSLFKCGPLDWRDIRSVDVKPYFSSEVVSLELADTEKYFARGLPKGNRNTGRYARALSSPFVIYPRQLQVSADTLLRAINERVALFGRATVTRERNP